MAKGSLPKAYLRIDPNLDQTHPDPGAMVRLLCAGARQPKRGRFKSWALLVATLGKATATKLRDLGDVKPDGESWVVDGWDNWQEGDLTVGERMARYRDRHRNAGVTVPFETPSPARTQDSKAVRQQGEEEPSVPAADAAPDGRHSWLTPYGVAWSKRWGIGSKPPFGEMAKAFSCAEAKALDPEELLARFERFLLSASTSQFARPVRFIQGLGEWAEGAKSTALVVAGGKRGGFRTRSETNEAAAEAFIAGAGGKA